MQVSERLLGMRAREIRDGSGARTRTNESEKCTSLFGVHRVCVCMPLSEWCSPYVCSESRCLFEKNSIREMKRFKTLLNISKSTIARLREETFVLCQSRVSLRGSERSEICPRDLTIARACKKWEARGRKSWEERKFLRRIVHWHRVPPVT